MAGLVARGRDAFERQAWNEAYESLAAAEAEAPLDPADLDRLAVAAYLTGRDEQAAAAWERAHVECLKRDDCDRAAQCALWLGLALVLRGEMARAGGWFGRAATLIEERQLDCPTSGYLLVPAALGALEEGDAERALSLCAEAGEIGRRFGDADLMAFGRLGRGQACVALGRIKEGTRHLDEVMVAVTTGELSPVTAGIVYCAVIQECMTIFDLRRAAEWTEALSRWCDAQPDLVPYRGQCLVHRSQVMLAHGRWPEAVSESERALRRLTDPPHPALGMALYQQAELHRLRGEIAEAEAAYRRASEHGREPVPGLALLRLAGGDVDAAAAMVRRMLDEQTQPGGRPLLLAAAVEIMLAAGNVAAARTAADELGTIVAGSNVPLLRAMAAYAEGSVRLGEGDASGALTVLRDACAEWRRLEMPYDMARGRVLIAHACRALGDGDTAAAELDAARTVFERLGAQPDLAGITEVAGAEETSALTSREREVLRLVAAGKTNREIAAALVISEHTVARHLQNMFLKLGLSSRAAATAYAYEHGLV